MSGRLVLIRHAETAFNKSTTASAERLRGWLDIPLDAHGKEQTKAIAETFEGRHVNRIYTSPLQRATYTAKAIRDVTLAPLIEDRDLMPWNIGDWAGKPARDVIDKMSAFTRDESRIPPNGESFGHFRRRYLHALSGYLDQARQGKTIVVVTHSRNIQCAKAWSRAGRPKDLSISTQAMNDYTHENPVGSELVIDPLSNVESRNPMEHKRPSLAILIGQHPPGASDSDKSLPDGEDAAKDFLQAVEEKDAHALFLAFKALHEACCTEDDEEEEDDAPAGDEAVGPQGDSEHDY